MGEGLLFCLANETDLAVYEMSEGIYGGYDYLTLKFLNHLKDSDGRTLIAEKDGRAVGLQVMHFVDEKETVIVQGLRVHLGYRRQGIGKRLIQECRDYAKQNFPRVKVERFAMSATAVEHIDIVKKSEDALLDKVAIYRCSVNGNSSELSFCLRQLGINLHADLPRLSQTELFSLLQQGKLATILFKNRFIVNWELLEALASNISNGLSKEGDSIFATLSSRSVQCLSHSQWRPLVKCPQLVTSCYTLDEELLKAHIVAQLGNAIHSNIGETFLFTCFVDISLVKCASQLVFNDLSLKISEEFEYCDVYFYEKPFT